MIEIGASTAHLLSQRHCSLVINGKFPNAKSLRELCKVFDLLVGG